MLIQKIKILNKVVLIISDLHLGDGSKKEDFFYDEELCDFLYNHRNDFIILNGDIFELWQNYSILDIIRAHKKVTTYLSIYADVIIKGNHDNNLKNFFGKEIVDNVVIGDTIIMHGHQFDILNSGPLSIIGRLATWLTGLGEKFIHTNWERWMKAFINKWGRYSGKNTYYKRAKKFAKQNGFKNVIIGHTHKYKIKESKDFNYYNSGTWIDGNKYEYLRINVNKLKEKN